MLFTIFIVSTCLTSIKTLYSSISPIKNATMGRNYSGIVANGQEDIYHFRFYNEHLKNSTVRIKTISEKASENSPVVFVARLVRGVVSWSVPFITEEGTKYSHVTQTLCPSLNLNVENETTQDFFLDVSTALSKGISYTLIADIKPEFHLKRDSPEEALVNPAEPTFYVYNFNDDEERVLVKVESESRTCAKMLIQTSKCPNLGMGKTDYSGVYATFTKKAAIVIEKDQVDKKFYVILIVKDSDTECQKRKGTINPFAPPKDDPPNDAIHIADSKKSGNSREKKVTVSVESLPSNYAIPTIAPVIFFGSFYLIGLIILVINWCFAEDGGRSFYAYLFPSKVKGEDEEDSKVEENAQLLATPGGSRPGSSYGGYDNPISPDSCNSSTQSSRNNKNDVHREADEDSVEDGFDRNTYDWLDDIDSHKDVYRLKTNVTLDDLSRKSYKKLNKKVNVYYWNILTVSVFYALPVVQLVLTYQRVVNSSGDQDICYYNNFCQRPYYMLSAFNNVYSNIGYMMLGLLFIFLVLRRDRLSKQKYVRSRELEKKYGIPQHYGILYAMGYALFMEGVMSACYHVCPNYSNFQFDTAFMYMIGVLGCLRLYQTRHHDIFVSAPFAFAGLAFIIFIAVLGVIFRSREFWIVFLLAHFAACLYVSFQIYYMGRIRTAIRLNWLTSRKNLCARPVYPIRLVLLLLFNAVNWGLSINGIINIPKDFMTYLLGIIVVNGLLYVVFYTIMKIVNKERMKPVSLVGAVLSLITWGVSISFFIQGLTDWQVSPAESREGNRSCRLLDFYDDHDVWHFLSATALFFSFVGVLTLDDDLDNKERCNIRVF